MTSELELIFEYIERQHKLRNLWIYDVNPNPKVKAVDGELKILCNLRVDTSGYGDDHEIVVNGMVQQCCGCVVGKDGKPAYVGSLMFSDERTGYCCSGYTSYDRHPKPIPLWCLLPFIEECEFDL